MSKVLAFISYFHDQKDRVADISEEEYAILEPHESSLRAGNWPGEVDELISDIMNNRSKEVDEVFDYDLGVAIC